MREVNFRNFWLLKQSPSIQQHQIVIRLFLALQESQLFSKINHKDAYCIKTIEKGCCSVLFFLKDVG